MNMSLLHTDDAGDDRYGQFRLGDDELVVYDRENAAAWVRGVSTAVRDSG